MSLLVRNTNDCRLYSGDRFHHRVALLVFPKNRVLCDDQDYGGCFDSVMMIYDVVMMVL